MTAPRHSPLTRAEVEGRISDLKDRLVLLNALVQNVGTLRAIAGTKSAINVMERKLREWPE